MLKGWDANILSYKARCYLNVRCQCKVADNFLQELYQGYNNLSCLASDIVWLYLLQLTVSLVVRTSLQLSEAPDFFYITFPTHISDTSNIVIVQNLIVKFIPKYKMVWIGSCFDKMFWGYL